MCCLSTFLSKLFQSIELLNTKVMTMQLPHVWMSAMENHPCVDWPLQLNCIPGSKMVFQKSSKADISELMDWRWLLSFYHNFSIINLPLHGFRLTVSGEYGTIWPTKTCSRTLVLNKWKCYLSPWVTMSINCFLNLLLVMEGLDTPCSILLIPKHWKLLHLGLNLQLFVGM